MLTSMKIGYNIDVMLTCTKCKIEKSAEEFYIAKNTKSGRQGACISCSRAKNKVWRETHPEQKKASDKVWLEANIEKKKATDAAWYSRNAEDICRKKRADLKENPEKRLAQNADTKARRKKNPDKSKAAIKALQKNNPEKRKVIVKRYFDKNPNARIARLLRNTFRRGLRYQGVAKTEPTATSLGCTAEEAYAYLATKFLPAGIYSGVERPAMTAELYGKDDPDNGVHGIHIDHISPLSDFDLSDPEERKKAFHYTNLQPLWGRCNTIKANRLDWIQA